MKESEDALAEKRDRMNYLNKEEDAAQQGKQRRQRGLGAARKATQESIVNEEKRVEHWKALLAEARAKGAI